MEIMPKRHDHRPEINARLAAERTPKRKEPLDRLTRDSIAAEKAGMSYGQYKALHPHTPDEDETPPKPKTDPGRYEFICQTCGKVYYKTNMARQKYCSYNCSREAARLRYEALHPHTSGDTDLPPTPETDPGVYARTCTVCGKVFYHISKARVKYCGDYCRSVAKSQRDAVHRKQKRLEEKAND